VLVVAAFSPELSALASEIERAVVGVGLVESALGAARVVASRKPDAVVLVGTAGAYPNSSLKIGDVIVARDIVLASPSGALIEGAMPTSIETDVALSASLRAPSVVVGRVATTLAITTDDAVARTLEDATHAHAEHLEAFAVARACAVASVPFTAVLGIANAVGARGRDEWRANHERAAEAACRVIRNPTRSPSRA